MFIGGVLEAVAELDQTFFNFSAGKIARAFLWRLVK